MWKILKFVSAKHNIFNKMVFGINVALLQIHQYHCFPVPQSYMTLGDPMDCSTPGFPVHNLSPGFCSDLCPLSQ